MNTFSRTPSFNSFNSPTDKSTKRFTRMKQNLDINNIRASNYKSALERTFERASQIEDYNFYGSIYQDFSSPSSFSSKFTSSSSSFFSTNQQSLSSYSRNSALRHNSNSSIKPYKNKFTTTPSSLFNKKWDSNIGNNNYSHQSYNYYNYDAIEQNDYNPKIKRDHSTSFSNAENKSMKKQEERTFQKKEKEIIMTPNRVISNKKKFISENKDHNKEFDIDSDDLIKDDTIYEAFNKNTEIEEDPICEKDEGYLNENIEEEETTISSKSHTTKDFIVSIEEEEEDISEKQSLKSNTSTSKEAHSQAYLNAMNSVNSKMKQFNSKINQNTSKKSQKTKDKKETDNNSKKDSIETKDLKQKDHKDMKKRSIQKEDEDEFKKKQRVELEEIKSLYALLAKELKQIQKESNNTASISEIDNDINNENDLNLNYQSEELKEIVVQDSNTSS